MGSIRSFQKYVYIGVLKLIPILTNYSQFFDQFYAVILTSARGQFQKYIYVIFATLKQEKMRGDGMGWWVLKVTTRTDPTFLNSLLFLTLFLLFLTFFYDLSLVFF